MVLLWVRFPSATCKEILPLHSTVVLLWVRQGAYIVLYRKAFTFHCGSIMGFNVELLNKSMGALHSTVVLLWEITISVSTRKIVDFTFHCGSIMGKIKWITLLASFLSLHSTVVLLWGGPRQLLLYRLTDFTFHCGSIMGVTDPALHTSVKSLYIPLWFYYGNR